MAERKRQSPAEARESALQAARLILIESGPSALTLQAVAARIGRTHANLLHHFGSAAGLQQALATYLAERACAEISRNVLQHRAWVEANPEGDARTEEAVRETVRLTFDVFDHEGCAALVGWMLRAGDQSGLAMIGERIHRLVHDLHLGEGCGEEDARHMHHMTLALVVMALGDALIGAPLTASLGLSRDTARDVAAAMLLEVIEQNSQARR